jgi:hypothetical protein
MMNDVKKLGKQLLIVGIPVVASFLIEKLKG